MRFKLLPALILSATTAFASPAHESAGEKVRERAAQIILGHQTLAAEMSPPMREAIRALLTETAGRPIGPLAESRLCAPGELPPTESLQTKTATHSGLPPDEEEDARFMAAQIIQEHERLESVTPVKLRRMVWEVLLRTAGSRIGPFTGGPLPCRTADAPQTVLPKTATSSPAFSKSEVENSTVSAVATIDPPELPKPPEKSQKEAKSNPDHRPPVRVQPIRCSSTLLPLAPNILEAASALRLESQYRTAIDTLQFYGFLNRNGESKKGDVPAPCFADVMTTFSPEQLALARTFQGPTLLLVPENSFAAKVKALNRHPTMPKQYVSDGTLKPDTGSEKITGWRAVIVEGAVKMNSKPGEPFDRNKRWSDRLAARKANRKAGEKGMDRNNYLMLMMHAVRKHSPIDVSHIKASDEREGGDVTLLEEDIIDATHVPYAGWLADDRPEIRGYRVYFFRESPEDISKSGNTHFRSLVGGDVVLRRSINSNI